MKKINKKQIKEFYNMVLGEYSHINIDTLSFKIYYKFKQYTDDLKKGKIQFCWASTRSNSSYNDIDNRIEIYVYNIHENDKDLNKLSLAVAIFHEFKHMIQHKFEYQKFKNAIENYIYIGEKGYEEKYENDVLEIDAEKFAYYMLRKNLFKIKNILNIQNTYDDKIDWEKYI